MNKIGMRLRELRESIHLSQSKIATIMNTSQVSIARIESGQVSPPSKTLLAYADYFNVSMDYIFCRTDHPEGKLYQCRPKIASNDDEARQLIEMCFDPKSPMNARLKEALFQVMKEGTE